MATTKKNRKGIGSPYSFSSEDRAQVLAVLAANGGNVSRTSQETGVDRKTIRMWREGKMPNPRRVQELLPEKLRRIAELWGELVPKALENSLRKVGDLDAYKSVLVGGIGTDKLLALNGMPSIIIGHTQESLQAMSQEDLDKMEAMMAKTVDAQDYTVGPERPQLVASEPKVVVDCDENATKPDEDPFKDVVVQRRKRG